MNFYKHHIGDYDQATRHLSFVEDAAYCRLIRKYYADEGPLPKDLKKVQKLIAARTKEEKSAVETVLEEFFTLEDDGWHQKRCDEELEAARVKAERNRQVGKLGGRPRKTETQTEPTENPDGFETETQTVSENNPSQKPDTRLQTPEEKQQHNHGGESRAAEGSIDRHVQVAILLRGLGVSPITPMHPTARELAETGASDEQLRAAVDVARERKPAPEAISPNYLKPILAEILNPPKPRAPKAPPLHAMTDTQLNAEGKRSGAGEARIGESRHEYIARIQTAQAIAQGRVAA